MKMRYCPYCWEKIKYRATVCRFCHRDLPELKPRRGSAAGPIALMTASALFFGTAAFLALGFLKERRYWLQDGE